MKTDRRGLRWVELKSGARRLPAGSALGGRAARAQPGAARCPPLEERDSKMGRIFDPLQPLVGAATCSSLPFLLAWCHQPVAHTMEKVMGALEFSRGMLCRTHATSDLFGTCLPQDCMPRCLPAQTRAHTSHNTCTYVVLLSPSGRSGLATESSVGGRSALFHLTSW